MSNLTKLEFLALDISSKNYLSWVLDAEIHLDVKGLRNTILADKEAFNQDKAKATIFIRHHLHEGLKMKYLTVKDHLELSKNLKEQFDHSEIVILPKARYDWIHLRLKHFQPFHATNVLLQQQYREKCFKRYSKLISCFLVAEQNNELLMKNYGIRPIGSAPFPKVNVAVHNNYENRKYRGHSHSRRHSEGRGQGRTSNRYHGGHNNDTSNHLINHNIYKFLSLAWHIYG
ncbi:hypothetical protein V6Z12_A02G122500 [Gossypium hirsutum]